MKTTSEIRSDFLDFFRAKGHTIVPSAPLVPGNDPTLLFTNSGMVQFKDVFLGAEKRSYVRAADVQRCLRAGGKHNDLDQVGYTARHHTFFEMLGNWSLRRLLQARSDRLGVGAADAGLEAAGRAPAGHGLPHRRRSLSTSGTSDIGLPAERIIRIGDNKGAPYASDNFWQMADTGPCGPCTEIFYDHGAHIPGGPPGSPDEDGDRFIEIWNLVFMQFDRQPDGSLQPLPAPCVDTGMGLERLAAVLQHVHGNYEIDLFQHLIKAAARLTGTERPGQQVAARHRRPHPRVQLPDRRRRAALERRSRLRAAPDHPPRGPPCLEARRAAADGYFWRMVAPLCEVMGDAYPELVAASASSSNAR